MGYNRKFKDYLWGATVEVVTDNNMLVYLNSARLGAVEQHWEAKLANYNYTLHTDQAKLTRMPIYCPGNPASKLLWCKEKKLANTQHPQSETGFISNSKTQTCVTFGVRNGVPTNCSGKTGRGCKPPGVAAGVFQAGIEDQMLQRKRVQQDMGEPCTQTLVPIPESRAVWKEYHRHTGHPNPDKIVALLRHRYFSPGMTKDVALCQTFQCITNKPRPEVRAPLVPIQTSYLFQIVVIDHLSLGRTGDSHHFIND